MKVQSKKHLGMITAMALVAAGCSSDPGPDPDPDPDPDPQGFQQPANTVALSFTIDASGRKDYYAEKELEWKGSFTYDEATRMLTYDSSWAGGAGPYPPLYDDGPYTTGGHEPIGAVAGDDKFGITVFLPVPTEELTIKWGAQLAEGEKCTPSPPNNGCWIWPGSADGELVIPAGDATARTADGFAFPAEGTNDLKLTLDTNDLGSGHTLALPVKVKGTFSDWALEEAFDDGTHGDATANDGIFTYTLSSDTPRRLKLSSGTRVEFVWQFGNTDSTPGTEYKTTDGSAAETTGVKAFTKGTNDADFGQRTVTLTSPPYINTAIEVP